MLNGNAINKDWEDRVERLERKIKSNSVENLDLQSLIDIQVELNMRDYNSKERLWLEVYI